MELIANKYVIVVAAGSGTRFGASLPKQFCDLDGRPVLMWTIDRLRRGIGDCRMILVLSESGRDIWHEMCIDCGFESPEIVIGGSTRWESVKNALNTIGPLGHDDMVLVHDGARPLVSAQVIGRLLEAMEYSESALPCIRPVDSFRLLDDNGGSRPLDRSRLLAVQTPQAFRGDALQKAYATDYSPLFTDDASVMAAAGFPDPVIVDGDPRCIKITLPADIGLASLYLRDERSADA
ncbi:MAG: 2-C-methyl-D-erythritol 4-phosphate cytidylyltransferase [Muribaculum sp.]|nr:2-C-methyl-D-erythritol 4-phosphate cytidylyltransferase [Muribaculum sp.]